MELTKKDRTYFNIAKEISKMSDFPRIHIGACVVYQHKVISSGFNTKKTHTLQKKYNKFRFQEDTPASMHAETQALLPLIGRKDIDFSRVSIYVYRALNNGELTLARPCPSCMALIRNLGIRHIYYTSDKSYVNEELVY